MSGERQTNRLSLSTAGLALGCATLAMIESSASAGIVVWDGTCGTAFWASTCNPGSHTNWLPDVMPTLSDDVSANVLVTLFGGAGDASTVSFTTGLNITNGGVLNVAGTGGTIRNLSLTNSFINAQNAGTIVEIDGNSTSAGGAVYGDGKVVNIGTLSGFSLIVKNVANHPGHFVNTLGGSITLASIGTEPDVLIDNDNATLTLVPHPQTSGGAIGVSGHGLFTNTGTFITQGDGSVISNFSIGCSMLQSGGSFVVQGRSNATGTVLSGGALFAGGEILMSGDANMRFQAGAGSIYEFDGMSAFSGQGNAYVQLGPFVGPDWRVLSDLDINLTGSSGWVIESGHVTLTGKLENLGKAMLSGGTIRNNTSCTGCAPWFSNQGSLTINSNSLVTVDTWLRNEAGHAALHAQGSLAIGNNGLVDNEGVYEHRRGNISRAGTMATSVFLNRGVYLRPAHVNTQDVQISAPFINLSGIAQFDLATTTFAGEVGSGLFLRGGDVSIDVGTTVRVGGGDCDSDQSDITGSGEFHIGGLGGPVHFDVLYDAILDVDLGVIPDAEFGGLGGGLYLDASGRLGGTGQIINHNQFIWNSGVIGYQGAGGLYNEGYTELNSGSIDGTDAWFFNDYAGVVEQLGGLSIFNGIARNFGVWWVLEPVTLSSFGTGIFQNLGYGKIICDAGAGEVVNVNAKFDNSAFVEVRSGRANFANVVQVTGSTLDGGGWYVWPGATLDLPGNLTTIGPGAHVEVFGTLVDLATIHTSNGWLSLDGVNWNRRTVSIGGMIELRTENGVPNQINSGTGEGQCILCYAETKVVPSLAGGVAGGSLPFALQCGVFNNGGTVRPGGYNAAGPFKMDGNFNQTSAGTLDIELGGEMPITQHDQLIVDGNVALGGTLNVKALPGFLPSLGQQFTVVLASNGVISGQFSAVTGSGQYGVAYSPGSVTITVITPPKPGDITGDGHVNTDDLIALIVGWGLCPAQPAPCPADLDGNGLVNTDDLLVLIVNWG